MAKYLLSDDAMLELTRQLVRNESVSPDDAGCQKLLSYHLAQMGFEIEHLPFGAVSNLWAVHGDGPPYFVFAGHTDVVPPGPLAQWQRPPFEPNDSGDYIYGRGTADMKGSLAAMIGATNEFLSDHQTHQGTIAFLITSDEEGDAIDGTRKVMLELQTRGIQLNWCLIGEPSSNLIPGDVIRTGRRGSLHAKLKVIGIQGHVAYPDKARNPIHQAASAITELVEQHWDEGNDFFPPTSMQISNIHAGSGISNVIPGQLDIMINFRFSTESTRESLVKRTETILDKNHLDYTIEWTLSGSPFLTMNGELINAVKKAIKDQLGIETELSTSGGTSDGRFIAPRGTQVVELGPCNETIHQVNERVSRQELKLLRRLYRQILIELVS